MKILLINPWQKSLFGDEMQAPGHPHLGLAYLSAALKQNNYTDILTFDQGLEQNDQILFDRIREHQPDVIGITSFSYCIDYAISLIDRIKEESEVQVIIGGAHVSAVREKVLQQTRADFAMYGESEVSIVQFLHELEGDRQFFKVGNLIWRDALGSIITNAATPLIKEVDAIPLPDYDVFDFKRYNYYQNRALPIITSRGCPYGCNYCSVKLSMGRGFRANSPEHVVQEMKYWVEKYGIKRFEVNDDCFSLDLKRAEAICDRIMESGLNITYEMYNGIRADRVSERLLTKMRDSGCVFVSFGSESGNQEVMDAMGKNLKLEKVREAVELTNKVGIRNSVNFIIGHIGETYETAMETLRFAQSLPTNFVNFYNLVPYPGTSLYDWVKKEATLLIPEEVYLKKVGSRDVEPIFETPEFPRAQRIKAMQKGFALYEKSVLIFRFGKVLGTIAYMISRNRFLFAIGRKVALGSRLGFYIYSLLSWKSRAKTA